MTTSTLRYPGGLTPTTPADLDDNLMGTINRCRAIADLIQAVSNSEDACVMDTTIGDAAWAIITDLEDTRDMVNRWYERARVAAQEEDVLAGIDSRSLIYRGILDSVGGSLVEADKIIAELDKQLAEHKGS